MILHNADALRTQINMLGKKHSSLRMYRLPNDLLPLRQHLEVDWLYGTNYINDIIQDNFKGIADLALQNEVRLFMQASPFTNLSSSSKYVVNASLIEIEIMAKLAYLMGFREDRNLNDFTIVMTMNHNQDNKFETARRIIQNYMSVHAKRLISLKNDCRFTGMHEIYHSAMASDFPIVFDVHASWVKSNGWYPTQVDRSLIFLQSWKTNNMKPLIYVAQPDCTGWPNTMSNPHALPSYLTLYYGYGIKHTALSKHSGPQWNQKLNYLFSEMISVADVYVDSPWANLAQEQLYDFAVLNDFI